MFFQVGVGSRKIKVRSLGREQVSCQKQKEEFKNSELKKEKKSRQSRNFCLKRRRAAVGRAAIARERSSPAPALPRVREEIYI